MAWQTYADKYCNTPGVFLRIYYDGGSYKYYSIDYIRTPTQLYEGRILSLPQISNSVGHITRTYEKGNIYVVISDTDYELRSLLLTMSRNFINSTVRIQVGFQDDTWASLTTIYTGYIVNWTLLDNLQIQFEIAEKSRNLDNYYPKTTVTLADYANAHSSCRGLTIPIPYGTISALGTTNDGAYGWPQLTNSTGLAFVNTTQDSEQHLIGLQMETIYALRVYLNGVLQTVGVGNDYTVSTNVIDGETHTTIDWEAGVRPTEADFVSCDITAFLLGAHTPVTIIGNFLWQFCGYTFPDDFNEASGDTAYTIEVNRGYDAIAGAFWESKPLRTILDEWRNEFNLDIYWGKDGLIYVNYLSSDLPGDVNHYEDYLDILDGDFMVRAYPQDMINKLIYGYNYHYSKTYYYSVGTEQDAASQTKYGGTFRQRQNLNWVRSAAMADDLAVRKVLRHKDPPKFIYLNFPLKTYTDDLTDALKITHYGGEDDGGYDKKLMQIREQNFNLNDFTNEMVLEDTSNFAYHACVLGDTDLAASWGGASTHDKQYWYLCSRATGQFADGTRGKQLLD